ncbi:HAD family phosphatase [Prauserella sp. ASG 168]|uniref:HAD family phosphatase n=2 Tax=Prauserella cavernicola TaxID=2800127 RepID=A0A934QQK6_9PSEU|nr:HAD family phosphatase [Prauserella cavernicola]
MGAPLAAFEPAYWAARDAYDRGASDLEFWSTVGDALDVRVDEATSARLTELDIEGWSHVAPESLELVESLAEAGAALAVLSNAPVSFARFAEEQPWTRHFSELLFSGDVGMAKPDAKIFELLLARLGAEPGDCLFFDDRQANVDGARAAGLHAHVWQGIPSADELL